MGRPDYTSGQFRETARCRDAQHGGRVRCAFAPQLVLSCLVITYLLTSDTNDACKTVNLLNESALRLHAPV